MLRPAALQALGRLLNIASGWQPDIESTVPAAFTNGGEGLLGAPFDLLAWLEVAGLAQNLVFGSQASKGPAADAPASS